MLPDWGKDLGESLAGLGKGVSHIIDPLVDFHTKFAEQYAANPEMGDNLAGHAFVNEGDLGAAEKFIPKKILADIKSKAAKGNVPPEFMKIKAGIDVGRMERDPQGNISPEQIAKLKPYGGFTNQEWYDLGRAKIAGESIGATSEGLAQAPMAKLLGSIKTEEARNILAYRAGLTPAQKQTMDAFKYDELLRFNMRVQADNDMMNARDAAEFRRQSALADERMGYWETEHNGGGDPTDWVTWMHNSKLRDKVKQDIASGQMDEEDNKFAEINRLYQARDSRINSLEQTRLNTLINSTSDRISGNSQKKIKPADESMRGELLTRLNVDLAHYAASSNTDPVQAFYGNLYQLKKSPIGKEEDHEKLQKKLEYGEYHRKIKEQGKAKENRLHYVANPYTPNAKEVDPNDVSDMLSNSVNNADKQAAQDHPVQQQPVKSEQVTPPHTATSDDIIKAARERYTVVRDTLVKSGMSKADAQKRAAFVTDSIFNTHLSQP